MIITNSRFIISKLVVESRPVIISYSEIYDLGFDEDKIDESLNQVSRLFIFVITHQP